jgi:YVTN family beta-propeller protein
MNSETLPDKLLYSTNTDSDDISVADPATRKEIIRIPVGGSPRGAVKFDKTKTFGYVSNCAGNTVSVIDLCRNREVARITVGLAPRGLALSEDGRHLFVSNSGSNTLSVVDLVHRQQIAEVAMGANPRHMATVPGGHLLLVAVWGSDSVAILQHVDDNKIHIAKSVCVGENARPYSLAVTKKGDRAYVANTQANYMSVIDVPEAREIARVTVGEGGRAIAFLPDEKHAVISVENANKLAVVDLADNKVVHEIPVGASPRGVVVDPASKQAYVAAFKRSTSDVSTQNALNVVDLSGGVRESRYVTDIRVGLGPCSVSILDKTSSH